GATARGADADNRHRLIQPVGEHERVTHLHPARDRPEVVAALAEQAVGPARGAGLSPSQGHDPHTPHHRGSQHSPSPAGLLVDCRFGAGSSSSRSVARSVLALQGSIVTSHCGAQFYRLPLTRKFPCLSYAAGFIQATRLNGPLSDGRTRI